MSRKKKTIPTRLSPAFKKELKLTAVELDTTLSKLTDNPEVLNLLKEFRKKKKSRRDFVDDFFGTG